MKDKIQSFAHSIIIIFISLVALVIVTGKEGNAGVKEIPCSTFTEIDLLNGLIVDLDIVNGKACRSEGLPDICDWEYKIIRNEVLTPESGKEIRLIVINENHLSGSGAWDTVHVFDCYQGNLRQIFENRYLYGVKIEKNTDRELILTSGEWQSHDPTCCPSGVKKEIYHWNINENKYILENAASMPRL